MEEISGIEKTKALESVYVALTIALPELLNEVGIFDVADRLKLFQMGEWNWAKIYLRETRYELAKTHSDLYPFLAIPFSECYSAVWAACAVHGHAAFGKKAACSHAERTLDAVTQSIRELRKKKSDELRSKAPTQTSS